MDEILPNMGNQHFLGPDQTRPDMTGPDHTEEGRGGKAIRRLRIVYDAIHDASKGA